MIRCSHTLLIASTFSCAAVAADTERRNPFRQPAFLSEAALTAAATGNPTDGSLLISAILVAGNDSLVSVSGTVIGIGEEVRGYTLKSVDEETAIFARGNETLTVSLFSEGVSDED